MVWCILMCAYSASVYSDIAKEGTSEWARACTVLHGHQSRGNRNIQHYMLLQFVFCEWPPKGILRHSTSSNTMK